MGFPGESDEDFARTMDLIEEIGFDNSFSFLYSRRPGTPAASLPDEVPLAVKKERLANLQNRIAENAGVEANSKLAVFGALSLYLSFINLFQMLLQLFGVAREE